MRGFVLTNGFEINEIKFRIDDLIVEKKVYNNLQILRKTNNKFLNDKIFIEDDNYIILTEGVILNSLELMNNYEETSLKKTITKMYEKNGEQFFSELEGSFSGVLIDKNNLKTLVYTNQIGDKQIFYWKSNNKYIIASDIADILIILKEQGINYSLDELGSYCLLTHGFMLDDITLISEVRKITAGKYLKIIEDDFKIIQYHEFINTPNYNQTEEEIINKIDELFLKAVLKQVHKNKEYNYKNVAPLSAGLDARMVNYALDKLRIKNVLNFSYSESGFFDQTIPTKITEELKRQWLFKSLDNGLSLFYLDEVVKLNNGSVLYYGPAQVWDILNLLETKEIGLIHTGMLGDVILGTFFKKKNQQKQANLLDGSYSSKLSKELIECIEKFKYNIDLKSNQEMYLLYNRGFNGANLGSPLTFQFNCESFSPFYDLDFLEYCLTIPVELRWDHYIYDKWVLTKYPNASKYLHNGYRKIGERNNIKLLGRETNLKRLPKQIIGKLLVKLSLKTSGSNSKNNMNPLDYWYNNNNELKQYMDGYFYNHIDSNELYSQLKLSCKHLYENGNTCEKTQVLTLLAAINLLFSETNYEV